MQTNQNPSVETYQRTPDAFPDHSAETGAELASSWIHAHQAAMERDREEGIERTD